MKSLVGLKLINKMQQDLSKNGIVVEDVVKDLKELRPYALLENDPRLTKVIRFTYEHIEENETFDIPIPDDEAPEIDGEVQEFDNSTTEDVSPVESLDYLLSIMVDSDNPSNREDLAGYRDMLKEY